MSALKIETGTDNSILRTKSEPIAQIDKSVKKLADNMRDTLKKENGLGLAAPQVGVNKRMILVLLNHDTAEELVIVMVNPEISYASKEKCTGEEGCLSLPNLYKPVVRHKSIKVRFKDIKGNDHILELEDLNARIVQHEIDHLNGILFVDHLDGEAHEDNPMHASAL